MNVKQASKIINACEPGWRVIAVTVPTRALRVITDDLNITFRVEQLNPAENFSWRCISTHVGDVAWESLGPAIQDATNKQTRLKEKIKFDAHNKKMAMIRAQSPFGDNPVPFL